MEPSDPGAVIVPTGALALSDIKRASGSGLVALAKITVNDLSTILLDRQAGQNMGRGLLAFNLKRPRRY